MQVEFQCALNETGAEGPKNGIHPVPEPLPEKLPHRLKEKPLTHFPQRGSYQEEGNTFTSSEAWRLAKNNHARLQDNVPLFGSGPYRSRMKI